MGNQIEATETGPGQGATAGRLHQPCSPLRGLVPGRGWRRTYAKSPHVWENEAGNRVIVHSSINGITYRTNAGKSGFLYDHQEPLISALRRNASRKRAGLAAARVLMANGMDEGRRTQKIETTTDSL